MKTKIISITNSIEFKIFFSIALVLFIGLFYTREVNKNLNNDCHSSIEEFLSPSRGPGPDGVDVEDKITCVHNIWYNLNPFNN